MPSFTFRCALVLLLLLTVQNWSLAADKPLPDDAGIDFFEKRIRPVLAEHCYECHAAGKKRQGGLLLDTRAGIRRGGDSGEAVVPGKPSDSLLLSALRYDSFEMPPKGRLPKQVIADFEKWIRLGAPDPREGGTESAAQSIEEMLSRGREFWSFQQIRRPELPAVKDADWPAFVFGGHQAKPSSNNDKKHLSVKLHLKKKGSNKSLSNRLFWSNRSINA